MARTKLPLDWKQLTHAPIVEQLTKQFTAYEQRVRRLVTEWDEKGRDARKRGVAELERFRKQLQSRKTEIEKQVVALVEREGKKLNKSFQELVNKAAKAEPTKSTASAAAPKKKASSGGAKKSTATRSTASKGSRSRKSSGSSASAASPA